MTQLAKKNTLVRHYLPATVRDKMFPEAVPLLHKD